MRLLRLRDQGCRFPGCRAKAFVDAHHILPWSSGGPTDMSNIALQCRVHHRAVHEGGWRIEGDPEGELSFIGPDNQVLPHPPKPLRPDIAERFFGAGATTTRAGAGTGATTTRAGAGTGPGPPPPPGARSTALGGELGLAGP
ncbi:MAG: HNH endonuclease signature motif containing protein [Acidimicrobiales bacterium]